jgi:hypothetical protein
MSLYNLINGVSPAVFYLLPMLGKHPDAYPRFRNCFVDGNKLQVLTRTGGNNRVEYADENNVIKAHECFVRDFDWHEDATYAIWEFNIPEKYKTDFDHIIANAFDSVSKDYALQIISVFPKLEDQMRRIFRNALSDSQEKINKGEN